MFSKNMINYYFIFLSRIKPFDYVVDQEERKLNFVKNAGTFKAIRSHFSEIKKILRDR